MEIATGMVFLTDDGRVVRHRPVVATVPQRPSGPGETVAGVHEAPPLVPLDAYVVVVLGFLQRDAAGPLLLLILLLLVVGGTRLVLSFLCGSLGR